MTYQFLSVEMVSTAKTNGGFIDQKMFKTAGKYGFDSLFLTATSMQALGGYIDHIRRHLKPTCDYVLVTRNGGQHNKLGELMSKLVFDTIGKYVHPTRYRQIVETVSSKKLSSNAQGTISEDQKHSSVVQECITKSKDRERSRPRRTNTWGPRDRRWRWMFDHDFQTNQRLRQNKKKMTMGRSPKNTTFVLRPLIPRARILRKHPIL